MAQNWINPAGGSWSNPSNWNGGIPTGAAVFNLATGTPYVVTMAATETPEVVNVQNSQVAIIAGAGDALNASENLNITAGAGQTASFSFTGTSVNGTNGSILSFFNGMYNNMPGSMGGAGATFLTLNDTKFINYGDPYTFGAGSTATFNNSIAYVGMSSQGTVNCNASTLQSSNEVFGIGIGIANSNPMTPASLNVSNGSVLNMYSSGLSIGSYPYVSNGYLNSYASGYAVANVVASQISNAYILAVGGSGGILNVSDGSTVSGSSIGVGYIINNIGGGPGQLNVSGNDSVVTATQLIGLGYSGTLQVSSGGLVTTPKLNLSTGSTLAIALDEGGIQVSGLATLAGTLDVTLGSEPDPALGESFDLISFGSESGTFSTISLPPLDPGLGWNTQQLYTNGTISVTAVPGEPVGASMIGLGVFVMLGRRRAKNR